MAATLDDVVAELKKIKKLIRGRYTNESDAMNELNKPD